jgi:hypothetical protein
MRCIRGIGHNHSHHYGDRFFVEYGIHYAKYHRVTCCYDYLYGYSKCAGGMYGDSNENSYGKRLFYN